MEHVNKLILARLEQLENIIFEIKKSLKYSDIDLAKHSEDELIYWTLLEDKGIKMQHLAKFLTEKINLIKYLNNENNKCSN